MVLSMQCEQVRIGGLALPGEFDAVADPLGAVVFVHGSGSSRSSPRNRYVAGVLQRHRLSTLLFDLLTEAEAEDRRNVFDIALLSRRVAEALDWLQSRPALRVLPVGLFGASTGAAAALCAAAAAPQRVGAVVSRGGRPDLAATHLARVRAPTLLIVGGDDAEVLVLNRQAMQQMTCRQRLEVVPGATHLFEEAGALEIVADLAARWFAEYLSRAEAP
jgi:putative phosphoribosyl transferase